MEAEELRIGNFFLDQEQILSRVHGINDLRIRWPNEEEATKIVYDRYLYGTDGKFGLGQWDGYYEGEWQYYMSAIPLTENWMMKLGWEKYAERHTYSEWKLGDYRFHLRKEEDAKNNFGIQTAGVKEKSINYFNWNTKHVHQMQNIYYACTGEELKTDLI